MKFKRETIYTGPPSERTLCVVGDVTGSGTPDIVLAERNPEKELYYLTRKDDGSWQCHRNNRGDGYFFAGVSSYRGSSTAVGQRSVK